MYDIIIRNDNTVVVTNGQRIMQRSAMVDTVRILVPKKYNDDLDMSIFPYCMMEYVLPCSKKFNVDVLKVEEIPAPMKTVDGVEVIDEEKDSKKAQDERANYYQMLLPVDSEFTEEPGDIEVQFTFATEVDGQITDNYSEPEKVKKVRKTSKTRITIVPIAKWSDIMVEMVNASEDPQGEKIPMPVDILDKKLADINVKYKPKKDEEEVIISV